MTEKINNSNNFFRHADDTFTDARRPISISDFITRARKLFVFLVKAW